MKKILIFLMVLITATFSFAGCLDLGETSSSSSSSSSSSTNGTTLEPSFPERRPAFYEETLPTDANYNTMPRIDINTSGASISDTEEYTSTTISLSDCKTESAFTDLTAGIRERGNATKTFAKKSYRIRFTDKINPMNQGTDAERTWVLLANHGDYSLIRNYLALNMGSALDGLSWSPSASFVKVYLNNAYQGVYLLCDQVQVNGSRIDIETFSDDVDTGYFIELDKWALSDSSMQDGKDYVKIYGIPYAIKNQDEMSASNISAQRNYIKSYLKSVDDALRTHNETTISNLIDINSFVDMYILQEYFKNIDAGWQLYMFKDKGTKLYLTAPWDFDCAVGNDDRLDEVVNNKGKKSSHLTDESSWKNLYVGDYHEHEYGWGSNLYGDEGYDSRNHWFIELMKCDWFKAKVTARWNELNEANGVIDQVIGQIDVIMARYSDEFSENFTKWNGLLGNLDNRLHYVPSYIATLSTHQQQADFVKTWLTNRRAWLNDYFN